MQPSESHRNFWFWTVRTFKQIFCMFMMDETYTCHMKLLFCSIWVSWNFQNCHVLGFECDWDLGEPHTLYASYHFLTTLCVSLILNYPCLICPEFYLHLYTLYTSHHLLATFCLSLVPRYPSFVCLDCYLHLCILYASPHLLATSCVS